MRLKVLCAVVAGASFVAMPAMASDVTGLWQTPTKGGQVEISNCGGSLCGRVFSSDEIRTESWRQGCEES